MRFTVASEKGEYNMRCCVPSAQSKSHTSPPSRSPSERPAAWPPKNVSSIVESCRGNPSARRPRFALREEAVAVSTRALRENLLAMQRCDIKAGGTRRIRGRSNAEACRPGAVPFLIFDQVFDVSAGTEVVVVAAVIWYVRLPSVVITGKRSVCLSG